MSDYSIDSYYFAPDQHSEMFGSCYNSTDNTFVNLKDSTKNDNKINKNKVKTNKKAKNKNKNKNLFNCNTT